MMAYKISRRIGANMILSSFWIAGKRYMAEKMKREEGRRTCWRFPIQVAYLLMKHEMTLLSVVQCLLAASMNDHAFFDGDKCAKFRVFSK